MLLASVIATIVASAGNDSTCRPTFPACLPGVVSVGSVEPHGRAHYSNFGPWVRACAPGTTARTTQASAATSAVARIFFMSISSLRERAQTWGSSRSRSPLAELAQHPRQNRHQLLR